MTDRTMTVIKRIKVALENDRPSTVPWRSMLETSLFEIERLRSALEALLPYVEAHTDLGPDGEGWKSNELRRAIDEALSALGHK